MLAFFRIKLDSLFTKNLFCKEEIFDLLLICESLHLSGFSISNLNIRLFHHFHPYFNYI